MSLSLHTGLLSPYVAIAPYGLFSPYVAIAPYGLFSPYVAIAPYGLIIALCRYRSIRAHGYGYVLGLIALARIRLRMRRAMFSLRCEHTRALFARACRRANNLHTVHHSLRLDIEIARKVRHGLQTRQAILPFFDDFGIIEHDKSEQIAFFGIVWKRSGGELDDLRVDIEVGNSIRYAIDNYAHISFSWWGERGRGIAHKLNSIDLFEQ